MVTEKDLWIFLSHSNKDYELVRKVRNLLEEQGKRPLMFFLKCLDDDNEVFELVKREIDARSRFILCKSRNTENSDGWVQKEFRYIQEQNKPYEIIDLENSGSFNDSIVRLIRRSKVFISYSNQDRDFVRILEKELEKNAFDVWTDYCNLNAGDNFATQVVTAITDAAEKGYVLYIGSRNSMNSEWIKKEIEIAINKEGFIIPCMIDKSSRNIPDIKLQNYQWIDASDGTMQEKVQQIVLELKRIDVLKNSNKL